MSAFMIARVQVDKPEQMKAYQLQAPEIVKKYKGKYIARGGEVKTLEGPEENRRVVIIEFPTLTDAEAFFHSPEYTEARKLREGAGAFEFIACEGI